MTSAKNISTGHKTVYILIVLFVLFLILEGLLRIAGIQARRESPFFLLLRVHEYPEYFRRHPTLFWELVPNKTIRGDFMAKGEYKINSKGFRGPEFKVEKPDSVVRICCIGNSNTFGWEIPSGEYYSRLIEKLLNQRYADQQFEVINMGVPGYTSHQGLVLLKERALQLDPDIITFSFGWNDIWGAGQGVTDREQKTYSPFIIWLQNNLAKLHTYRALKYMLLEVTEKEGLESFDPQNPKYRVSPEEYRENLEMIHDICVDSNIIALFFTSPSPDIEVYFGTGAHSQFKNLFRIHEQYNQIVRDLRDHKGYWVVPLATYFRNQPGYFDPELKDYIHYNAKGHQYVAEIVTQFMRRYRIIEQAMETLNIED